MLSLPHRRALLGRPRIVAAPAAGTTWDPSNKDASITLSNGNRTATGSASGNPQVRSVLGYTTGIHEFTVSLDAQNGSQPGIGVVNDAYTLSATWFGNGINTVCWYPPLGQVYSNGSVVGTTSTATSGSVTFAVDIANQQVRCKIGTGSYSAWFSCPSFVVTGKTIYAAAELPSSTAVTADFSVWG